MILNLQISRTGLINLTNDTADNALGTITKTGDYEKNVAGTVTNQGVNVEPGSPYAAGGKQNGSATGYTTGAWEYMTVPALTPPQGGDPKFQNVCLDFDSSGIPVVGYLGTNLEFGKWLGE